MNPTQLPKPCRRLQLSSQLYHSVNLDQLTQPRQLLTLLDLPRLLSNHLRLQLDGLDLKLPHRQPILSLCQPRLCQELKLQILSLTLVMHGRQRLLMNGCQNQLLKRRNRRCQHLWLKRPLPQATHGKPVDKLK